MSEVRSLAERYSDALALPTSDVHDTGLISAREALSRAHQLRKFEIENYWKRGAYFWAFQLAAFTLLGLIWREYAQDNLTRNVLLIPAGLGAISSLIGLLTAKGSKFWQENWESHVDILEAKIEGRLTQVVFAKHGNQWSVSRVNERFFWILFFGWTILFLGVAFTERDMLPETVQPWVATVCLLIAFGTVMAGTRSRLEGVSIESGDDQWSSSRKQSVTARVIAKAKQLIDMNTDKPRIMLRDTIVGQAEPPEPALPKQAVELNKSVSSKGKT